MRAEKITVTTTAARLISSGNYPSEAILKVPSGGATVYIGDATVDATNGFPIAAGETYSFDLHGDEVWAVVGAGTQAVNILRRT